MRRVGFRRNLCEVGRWKEEAVFSRRGLGGRRGCSFCTELLAFWWTGVRSFRSYRRFFWVGFGVRRLCSLGVKVWIFFVDYIGDWVGDGERETWILICRFCSRVCLVSFFSVFYLVFFWRRVVLKRRFIYYGGGVVVFIVILFVFIIY